MTDFTATEGKKPEKVQKKLILPAPIRWVREIIALTIWCVAFAELFVFDIGSYLSARVPGLESALQFRFLILLGTISILWFVLGNRHFMLFVGYIVAYPFVVVCWIIPRFLFHNWAVVIAFSPAVHSVVTTFRASFILFSAALISTFAICLASNSAPVVAGMGFLAVYLVVHFVRRFRVAFSPSTVFADVSLIIRQVWSYTKETTMAKRPEGLDQGSPEYKQKFGQNLLVMYMVSTGLYFLGERLREVIDSRKLDLYFLGSLLYTFALTAIVFSLEYLGLERVLPGSFVGQSEPGLLQFLGFSFSTLMTSDISPLKPASGLAQTGAYVQLFGSLLIIVLLVFVVLTSIRERYKQDLDGVVGELREASGNIGGFLEANYELTVVGAEAWLLEFNPVVTKWFLKLRYGEQRAREISGATSER